MVLQSGLQLVQGEDSLELALNVGVSGTAFDEVALQPGTLRKGFPAVTHHIPSSWGIAYLNVEGRTWPPQSLFPV